MFGQTHALLRSVSPACSIAVLLVMLCSATAHAAFSPADIGGLVLWLDANNIDGHNNSTLSSGDKVSTWKDLSINGNDATQATSALQPIFLTGQTRNGSPAVKFNGSSQYLLTPATISGSATFFIVYNTQGGPASDTSGAPITLRSSSGSTFDSVSILNNVSPYPSITLVADGSAGNGVGINPAINSSDHLLAFSYDGVGSASPGSYDISYDLTPTTVSATGADSIGFAHTQGTIGQRDNDTTFFGGNISAILVYSGDLATDDPTDFNNIQQYLNSEFLPEPASLGLVVIGGLMLLRRRRT